MSSYDAESGAIATFTVFASSTSSTALSTTSSSVIAKLQGIDTSVKYKQTNVGHVWYGILALLGLATTINALFLVWSMHRRYGFKQTRCTFSSRPLERVALRRVPHAVLSACRILAFRKRVPYIQMTLLELVLTVLYLGGCLVWSFVPEDSVFPRTNLNPIFWGGNTAKLAAGQLPLAVALAMKNSPITVLTGIGHEKLAPLHRIVSRCILVLVWLHLVGAYVYPLLRIPRVYSPEHFLNASWKIAGLVGAIAQTITTIFGIQRIRRRYYEVFYSTHVGLLLIFLIAVHLHCIPVKFDKYVWSVWIIWGFDRLARAGRYLVLNVFLRPKDPKALVECIGADGLRVTLKRRVMGGWKAGQHAFIAFPKLGIESHPFTIGSICEKEESGEAEMAFTIRAMSGQTKILIDLAAPSGSCELTALVDGPYGHPGDIRAFSTCVFVAGGTGVTYTLARMHQLFRDILASDACANRVVFVWAVRTETESQWILADLAKIVALAPPTISLAIEIFVTSSCPTVLLPTLAKDGDLEKVLALSATSADRKLPLSPCSEKESRCDQKTEEDFNSQESGTSTPVRSDTDHFDSGATTPTVTGSTEDAFPLSQSYARIMRRSGRPDVRRILEGEVTASRGAVAVDVSGPDGLVNVVRSVLCQPFNGPMATLKGAPTVMLNVEQFRM
ncbi:hypothetical protein BC628DRAFT_1321773 [Trametes gibbosa]|nr:hypothetical protein BC628DRAFT_1321773 [Trametes gibbosa]